MTRLLSPLAFAVSLLLFTSLLLAQPQGFQRLTHDLASATAVTSISSDGKFAVGHFVVQVQDPDGNLIDSIRGARWALDTPSTQVLGRSAQDLGFVDGQFVLEALGVNSDGSQIVGANSTNAIHWIDPGPWAILDPSEPAAVDISSDSSAIISQTARSASGAAFVPFSPLGGDSFVRAARLSADGAAAAITSVRILPSGAERPRAVRWTTSGSQSLGFLPNGTQSIAHAISANGLVVVGESTTRDQDGNLVSHAFRKAVGADIQDLGTLSGDPESTSRALDSSADGSVIVGESDGRAFIWDAVHGMRDLQHVLLAQGHDVERWELSQAVAISDDGNVVVGNGVEPYLGLSLAWVARLDVSCLLSPPTTPRLAYSAVVTSKTQVPALPTGYQFAGDFQSLSITHDGQMTFVDWLLAPDDRRAFSVVAGPSDALLPVATQGFFSSDLGRPFDFLTSASIRPGGVVSFLDATPGLNDATEWSLFVGPAVAPPALAKTGVPAPDFPPDHFLDTNLLDADFVYQINESAQCAFEAGVVDPFFQVQPFDFFGSPTDLHLETFSVIDQPDLPRIPIVAIGSSGLIARVGVVEIDDILQEFIFALTLGPAGPGPDVVVARDRQQAADEPPGVTYQSLSGAEPQINDQNRIAFWSRLSSQDGEPIGGALYAQTHAGLRQVVKTGIIAPGVPEGEEFYGIFNFIHCHDGRIYFEAVLPPPDGALPSPGDRPPVGRSGIWVAKPNPAGPNPFTIDLVVLEGQPVQGSFPCLKVRSPSLLTATRAGGLALLMSAVGESTAFGSFYYFDDQNGLVRILSEGDPLTLTSGENVNIQAIASAFYGNGSSLSTCLNNRLDFVLSVESGFRDSISVPFRHSIVKGSFAFGCPGDFDRSGDVAVADIFAFLNAWFAQFNACSFNCSADIDFSGSVQVADIFAFLNQWFSQFGLPCP